MREITLFAGRLFGVFGLNCKVQAQDDLIYAVIILFHHFLVVALALVLAFCFHELRQVFKGLSHPS